MPQGVMHSVEKRQKDGVGGEEEEVLDTARLWEVVRGDGVIDREANNDGYAETDVRGAVDVAHSSSKTCKLMFSRARTLSFARQRQFWVL